MGEKYKDSYTDADNNKETTKDKKDEYKQGQYQRDKQGQVQWHGQQKQQHTRTTTWKYD